MDRSVPRLSSFPWVLAAANACSAGELSSGQNRSPTSTMSRRLQMTAV